MFLQPVKGNIPRYVRTNKTYSKKKRQIVILLQALDGLQEA